MGEFSARNTAPEKHGAQEPLSDRGRVLVLGFVLIFISRLFTRTQWVEVNLSALAVYLAHALMIVTANTSVIFQNIKRIPTAVMGLMIPALVLYFASSVIHFDAPSTRRESLSIFATLVYLLSFRSPVEVLNATRPIFQFLVGSSLVLMIIGHSSFFFMDRFGGVYHPNQLGAALSVTFIGYLYTGHGKKFSFRNLAYVGLGIGILLQTESRTSIIGFASALAIGFIFKNRRTLWLKAAAATVAASLIAGVVILSPAAGLTKIARTGNMAEIHSFTGRTEIWRQSTKLLDRAAWFGVGDESIHIKIWRRFARNYFEPGSAHNSALELALTRGVPYAIIIIILYLVSVASLLVTHLRKIGPDAISHPLCGASMATAVFVHGTMESSAFHPTVIQGLIAFWVIASGCICGATIFRENAIHPASGATPRGINTSSKYGATGA